MKLEKAPPYVVEVFEAVLATTPGTTRLMFGYPSGFRDGNMFCGVFGRRILVRLDEVSRAKLLALEGAETFAPMPGRPMKEYVLVPDWMLDDQRDLQGWVARAFAFAGTLPPKVKNAAKAVVKKKVSVKKAVARKTPVKKVTAKKVTAKKAAKSKR